PRESLLCVQFGVSRGAMREAVKALAAKGMLEARPRTGTKVRPRREWNLLDVDMLTWQRDVDAIGLVAHLNQLRRALEPGVAELAARNATPEDIKSLTAAVDRMERAARGEESRAGFVEADVSFHTALLSACRNPLFDALAQALHVALHIGFDTTSAVPGAVEQTVPLHRAVLEAVVAGNPSQASDAMRSVLDTADRDLDEAAASPASTSPRVEHVTWEGLDAIRMIGDRIALTVVPSRGARIVELLDRQTGVQWMSPPVRPPQGLHEGAVWEDQDCAGWDELCPNIAPVEATAAGGSHFEAIDLDGLATSCRSADVHFMRRISVSGSTLRTEYSVENLTDQPIVGCWAAHPILRLTDTTEVLLPPGSEVVIDSGPMHDHADEPGWRPWPVLDDLGGNWDRPGAAPGLAAKLFTRPGTTASVRVARDGAYLEARVDPREVPSFGLWLNNGGWPDDVPQRHFAVEPSFAAADSLALSDRRGAALHLEPRSLHHWSVEWTVGP
ncbi:MAG: FCD domain-containing protein, partial [Actinobacteria bacterium]|nr:FCD domain-containing protein [Actinomycetota bacterium]